MSFLIYLILTLVTGFVAGIFRYHPLVILFVAEILMAVLMLLQIIISSFLITLSPRGRAWSVEKGKENFGTIDIVSRAPFPVSRILIKGFSSYRDGSFRKRLRLSDTLDRGTLNIELPISGEYAGRQNLSLLRITLWDTLGFFFSSRKSDISVPIAVLPSERSLHTEFTQAGLSLINSQKINMNDPTRDRDEFRQLRDYAYGDPWRDVDWHKSAKADKLVVREYDRDAEIFVDIWLSGKGYRAAGTKTLDGFYELTSALIGGIMDAGAVPRMRWLDGSGHIVNSLEIRSYADRNEFFIELYEDEIYDPDFSGEAELYGRASSGAILSLGIDLVLYSYSKVVKKFSLQDIPEEIAVFNLVI